MSRIDGKRVEEVKISSAKKKISENLIDLKNIIISGSKDLLDRITPKKMNVKEKLDFNLGSSGSKKLNFDIKEFEKDLSIKERGKIEIEEMQDHNFFQYSKINEDHDEEDYEDDYETNNLEDNYDGNKISSFESILQEETNEESNKSQILIKSILKEDSISKRKSENNDIDLIKVINKSLLFNEKKIDFCHIFHPIGSNVEVDSISSEILLYYHVEKFNSFKTLFTNIQYEEYKRCAYISDNILYFCKLMDYRNEKDKHDGNLDFLEILSKFEIIYIYRILDFKNKVFDKFHMIKIEFKEKYSFNIVNIESLFFNNENEKTTFISEIKSNFTQNCRILRIDPIIN